MRGTLGGAMESLSFLADGLARKGHRVYLLCRKDSLLHKKMENIWDTQVRLVSIGKERWWNFGLIQKIARLIRDRQIEIVNAQEGYSLRLIILIKICYRIHAILLDTRRHIPRNPIWKTWFYTRWIDHHIGVSKEVKEVLVRKKYPPHKIEVILNGTPPEKYQIPKKEIDLESLRKKHNLKKQTPILGCVAVMKEQMQILKALPYFPDEVVLIFVGISETPSLKKLCHQASKGKRVIYVGPVSNPETLRYLCLFDVKILASTGEGLSQALLESMALGTPVVATDQAGNRSLIRHGENGLLFPNDDHKTMAKQVNQLLSDTSFRKRIIQAGKKTALIDFSVEKTLSAHETLFKRLIQKRG
ncbi:MAG: glycosyltransferase family 4 protein [Cytophagales bacterium]|nr:glycosyltransferase family 4 protein [Cytophagales bacterium]